jgi:hypothetical protein
MLTTTTLNTKGTKSTKGHEGVEAGFKFLAGLCGELRERERRVVCRFLEFWGQAEA